MAKAKDYYELLGVQRSATTDQIRSAYRKLARQYHPDVNKSPDAAKRFAEIQEAYDVLADAEKRKAYDRFGHAGVGAGPSPGTSRGSAGWTGAGPERRTAWSHSGATGFGTEDLGDIFEEIFGARGRAGASPFDFNVETQETRRAAQRGQDVEHPLSITFMTAALGGTEQLRFTSDGTTSTINVKIPPGIDRGAKLRVKGKGQPGAFGGPPGDLILTIEVGQHPYFRRDGLDLFIDVPITVAEAIQGVSVSVPLLDRDGNKRIEIKVPPGASSGRKLRVRGKGITDGSGMTGDYYAVIQIVAPSIRELSENGRRLVAELSKELKNPRNTPPFAEE